MPRSQSEMRYGQRRGRGADPSSQEDHAHPPPTKMNDQITSTQVRFQRLQRGQPPNSATSSNSRMAAQRTSDHAQRPDPVATADHQAVQAATDDTSHLMHIATSSHQDERSDLKHSSAFPMTPARAATNSATSSNSRVAAQRNH